MVEAADGRAQQAGVFPNPEAILAAQQLHISGNAPNEQEYLAGVEQAIPLARRLSKARAAELLDREVRVRGLEVKRREIRMRVHSAFAMALYQQKACQVQSTIQKNAERAVATTRSRVEAGDALRDDLARVEMELGRVKVEVQRAESLHRQALVALAAAVGDVNLSVSSLAGSFDETLEIPSLETLTANLSAHPEMELASADVCARNARVDLARAERFSDLKAQVLYHRLETGQENTMDVGLSIPLPLFNRNQGRLRETGAEVAAAEARLRTTQNELVSRLRESYLQLTTALANSRTLRNETLAQADSVLATAETRYAAGDIGLAEILPVRRDWAAVQLSYLESLRDVMQAWAEVISYTKRP